jgi:hypothetical protein
MKMMKSLLLGSAAGLVAIAGAQAADLPVKAKPVEYVKVCSAYGAGFYYIPGTDICLRVGGYVYIETGYNGRAAVPLIYAANIGTNHVLNRDDNRVNWRVNNGFIMDARTQSPIGTVRTYIQMGGSWVNSVGGAPFAAGAVNFERAFIQFAGITAGLAESYFSFLSPGYTGSVAFTSVAWHWTPLFAYTANFGNGLSGTISIEDGQEYRSRITAIGGDGAFTGGASPTTNTYGGQEVPEIVANLRVDQAWGSAQVSGALHQLRLNEATAAAGYGDTYGWAVLGGIEIKTPMIAPGDSIMLQGVYSKGAVEYTGLSSGPAAGVTSIGLKNTALVGPIAWIFDAIPSVTTGSLELTTAWSAHAAFRHYWNPVLRSAIWLGYNKVETPKPNPALFYPDVTIWQAGIGTIWSPAPTLDLDLSLLWTRLETGACLGAAGAVQLANCNVNADIWTIWTRWRRNF